MDPLARYVAPRVVGRADKLGGVPLQVAVWSFQKTSTVAAAAALEMQWPADRKYGFESLLVSFTNDPLQA